MDVRTPHVLIDESTIRAFCSAACATAAGSAARVPAGHRWLAHALRTLLSVPILALTSGHDPPPRLVEQQPAQPVVAAQPAPPPEPLRFGPAWPPSENDWAVEIASDAWIHPLDGPKRRMPVSDSRVFGAERPGERPGECMNGHCGVDLAGPWGEPVHAAHDGVVERVQRGPNEEHGGVYVRIAHRDGTIFTQYFHLAAIPRRIEPGVRVKVGEVIGLLGDTGVKHSEPHLHFSLSVRPSASAQERYMDPEPLIALWPLRVSVGDEQALVTQVAPGVPLGAALKHKPPSRRAARSVESAVATQ